MRKYRNPFEIICSLQLEKIQIKGVTIKYKDGIRQWKNVNLMDHLQIFSSLLARNKSLK